MRMMFVLWMAIGVATAGCGGGSGGDTTSRVCKKICSCFAEDPVESNFDEAACVTDCTSSSQSEPVPPSEACADCVNDATCEALFSSGGACDSACAVSPGS